MRKDFYRQEKGVLIIPEGKSKYNVCWTLDNILSGFRKFYEENGRWPEHFDLANYPYLPTEKTLQRKFGGIIKIRSQLGIHGDNLDHRKGEIRSNMMKKVGERGMMYEKMVYKVLMKRFHEPFVHHQSVIYYDNRRLVIDFMVFHQKGKFLIDVFFPSNDYIHFSHNVTQKYHLYKNMTEVLYLCVGSDAITEEMIIRNSNSTKTLVRRGNIILITYKKFLDEILKYLPLNSPYQVLRR